jgi:ParB-like chromosome segregation protein Spo0J
VIAPSAKIKIDWRAPNSLKPYSKNARSHPDDQIQKIANVIKEVGWTKPIVIDEKGMILAGHGALLAAKLLALAVVPCVVKAGLSAAQKRAYVLADNRVAEDSTWNIGVLGEELAALTAVGFDLSLTGFDPDELGARASGQASGVTEIETSELHDRFWISIRGPLKSQAKALQALRKATAGIEGVQVELGTTDSIF